MEETFEGQEAKSQKLTPRWVRFVDTAPPPHSCADCVAHWEEFRGRTFSVAEVIGRDDERLTVPAAHNCDCVVFFVVNLREALEQHGETYEQAWACRAQVEIPD